MARLPSSVAHGMENSGMHKCKTSHAMRKYVEVWAVVFIGICLLSGTLLAPGVQAEDEVVVYSARIEQLIKPMFDAFTAQTGIKVRYFTAQEAELFERLKAEGANTPADVLMTVDAGNLWLAEQA